jgi:hypothetical protein
MVIRPPTGLSIRPPRATRPNRPARRVGASFARLVSRAAPAAFAAAFFLGLGAVGSVGSGCSSSSSKPPQLAGCEATNGIPCVAPVSGGGSSPPADGGGEFTDSGSAATEAGTCAGASQIFGVAAGSCAACVAMACCAGPTSCPNDPNCVSIAVCVNQTCLANDQSCVPTCEGASAPGTITEYIQFQQCVGVNCAGCPALAAGASDF